jgi:aryl-alcohol dehydrogenase-like predicted oxidoreductase
MLKRQLGKSGITVSPLGLGGMPLGGEMMSGEGEDKYRFFLGEVDDQESISTIHMAMDMGINFFDTAPAYGAGHSEEVLGQAFAGRRDQVVIATKFGKKIDEEKKWFGRYADDNEVIENIRSECEGSLRRLKTDYIDLYQFHLMNFPLDRAAEVMRILEDLVSEGKIRYYAWSTNDLESNRIFAQGGHCTAIQFRINVLEDAPELLGICDDYDLGGIIRGPLASGFLTGKYTPDNLDDLLDADDFRLRYREYYIEFLKRLDAVQEILKSNGRTVVQGALAWLWARSQRTVPIPGFRTLSQAESNIKAIKFGPLGEDQMRQIGEILKEVQEIAEG